MLLRIGPCTKRPHNRDVGLGSSVASNQNLFGLTWAKSEILVYVEPKIWHKWTYLQNRNRLTDRTDCGCQGERGREGGIN